jgi:hypothetical protein
MMSINASCIYVICIEGLLPERWSDWLGGLAIDSSSGYRTILKGRLADQASLLGVLTKIHALNLKIVAAIRLPPESGPGTEQVAWQEIL